MSGFVKGVVIGVASFAAGFAVLSVVLPPPGEGVPASARSSVQEQPAGAMAGVSASLTAPEPAPLRAPGRAPASSESSGINEAEAVAAMVPVEPLAPEVSPAPDPVAALAAEGGGADGVMALPGEPAAAIAPEVALTETQLPVETAVTGDEPATDTVEPLTASGGLRDMPDAVAGLAPVQAVVSGVAPAADAVAGLTGDGSGADGAVAPVGTPVAAVAPQVVRVPAVPLVAALEAASDALSSAVPQAPVPVATAVAASAPEPASVPGAAPGGTAATDLPPPARPVLPVPAQPDSMPATEPLLLAPAPPVVPERPAVVAMPGTTGDYVVRRGGEALPALPPAVGGVTIRRPGPPAAPVPETNLTAPAAQADGALPPLRRHAADFTLAEGARPLGLVLIDAAEAEQALLALPFVATIALDPADPSAPARGRAYRAAGHEVALLAQGFPRLADASDVLVTLSAWQSLFPDALALIDVPVNGLGAQRALARDVAAMLAPSGMGAIALRDGGDALMAAARAEGVPALALYRQIEADSDITLRRMIDRAAFEAARRDGVVIAASATDPAVLAALVAHSAEGRDGVVLAPVSALLAPP